MNRPEVKLFEEIPRGTKKFQKNACQFFGNGVSVASPNENWASGGCWRLKTCVIAAPADLFSNWFSFQNKKASNEIRLRLLIKNFFVDFQSNA
jgi:hypothetical protein